MKKIISILLFAVLLASCNQNSKDSYSLAGTDREIVPSAKALADEPTHENDKVENQEVSKKKIIKDGRLGLRVEELDKTKRFIDSLLKNFDAYYANERFNNTDWESSYNLNIRIPSGNFESFIAKIEASDGKVEYKEIDARDVTDQFIDLETRLENKRNYLARYNDLLKQAKSIKEILEIQEKIRALEEEIESTTGRLKYLGDLVDYSTLDLTITKPKEFKYNPANRGNFFERLKQSLSKGWFGLVDFSLFVVRIWPFWIILSVFLYFLRKYKKKKKNL